MARGLTLSVREFARLPAVAKRPWEEQMVTVFEEHSVWSIAAHL